MTKHLKKMLSLVLALALVLTLCVPSMDAQAAKKKAKTKLTINKKSITLVEGKKQQLTVKYGKKNVTKKAACKWTTKNKKVATVKKGKITAVGAGKTTIIAKYQKKTVKCTVIVKAKGGDNGQEGGQGGQGNEDAKKVTISQTTGNVETGSTFQLKIMEGTTPVTSGVTWTSSDPQIATVDENGVITGRIGGTVTITATYNGNIQTCTFTIDGFNPATDLKTEWGQDIVHIDFDMTKGDKSDAEYEAEVIQLIKDGCTVSGYSLVDGELQGTKPIPDSVNVTKDQVCETAKYTFQRLPKTLPEFQAIMDIPEKDWDVDSKATGKPCWGGFNVMACTICAMTIDTWKPNPSDPHFSKHPIREILEYLNGPIKADDIANVERDSIIDSLKAGTQASGENSHYGFFEGATHTNNYTPNKPYVINMYKGPYYIEETSMITGTRPTTYMILVPGKATNAKFFKDTEKCEGITSDVYIDVWKQASQKKWWSYQNQCHHIAANIFRTPEESRD